MSTSLGALANASIATSRVGCPADMRILGTGGVLPGRDVPGAVLSNARLTELMEEARIRLQRRGLPAAFPPSSPDFPERRIGIRQRRVLDEASSVRDMAILAGKRALEHAEVDPKRVHAVVVSTVTRDRVVPAIATSVQAALGIPLRAAAFDVSLGCTGFVAALDVAAGLLAGGGADAVALVIGAEAMIRAVDACDRSTCAVFGDGAGAVVVERTGSGTGSPVSWTTRGEGGARITIEPATEPVMRVRCRNGRLCIDEDHAFRHRVTMDGNRVYRDMVRLVPECVAGHLEERGATTGDIDRFVFHQANARMLQAIARDPRLRIPAHKLPTNIAEIGNTSSASIPLLLAELARAGALRSSQRLLLIGFGTGYSLAITELRVL